MTTKDGPWRIWGLFYNTFFLIGNSTPSLCGSAEHICLTKIGHYANLINDPRNSVERTFSTTGEKNHGKRHRARPARETRHREFIYDRHQQQDRRRPPRGFEEVTIPRRCRRRHGAPNLLVRGPMPHLRALRARGPNQPNRGYAEDRLKGGPPLRPDLADSWCRLPEGRMSSGGVEPPRAPRILRCVLMRGLSGTGGARGQIRPHRKGVLASNWHNARRGLPTAGQGAAGAVLRPPPRPVGH